MEAETVLPSLALDAGVLVSDPEKLRYPGDLLHEAGHLGVMSPAERASTGPGLQPEGGFEMAAIAWLYAAALSINLDPAMVFHPAGYKGGSVAFLQNFGQGHYIGVPVLEWLEMTRPGEFPRMEHWLRQRISIGC
jgi:hypothetical protein